MSDPLRDFPPLPPEVRASLIAEMGLPNDISDEQLTATLGELLMDLCRMFAELLVEMVNNPEIAEFFVDQVRLAKKWQTKGLAQAAAVQGWEQATEDVLFVGEDGDTIEVGDWLWRDAEGRIRRAYGSLGGSHQRAITWDEKGRCVVGVEARDDVDVPGEDLDDPAGVHPKWRAAVEKYPIEFQKP